MLHRIREFFAEDREYFHSNEIEITTQNNHMLIDGCLVYAVVLAFYTILTLATDQPSVLRTMYYVFDVIHVALCVAVFARSRQCKKSYKFTQLFCILLELSILGFFALEGVYTSKTEHSLYIPIAILLILLLFIHKALYTSAITLLYVITYAVLSRLYKTPEAYTNDIYIAIATFLAANIGYVLIAKMRHREAAALNRYEVLSRMDQLTGLYNKSTIETLGQQIIEELNHECAFIILDLDNFKRVNDLYGHAAGDEVLSMTASALRTSFRDTDYIGRFGGDEYIVLMDNCREMEIIKERVLHIMGQIERLKIPEEMRKGSTEEIQVHCSVGITLKTEHDDFQTMFRRADRALYEAKSNGKGNYRVR